jgi:HD superfamily phosphodiesterase
VDIVAWASVQSHARLTPLGDRWAHARGVALRAQQIASAVDVDDRDTLLAAAYLHDVGYAPALVVHG